MPARSRGIELGYASAFGCLGDHMHRQRVLDQVLPLVPLTILCGVPGTGKSSLVRQLAHQLKERRQESDPPVVLVDFPRRRLGAQESMALAVEAFLEARPEDPGAHALISQVRRGVLDMDFVEKLVAGEGNGDFSGTVLLANYEWQSSPPLERLLVKAVRAGLDIVCTSVDPSNLEHEARCAGVTTSVIADSDLVLTREDVGLCAQRFGMEPTPGLVNKALEITAGHPMLVLAMFLRLSGVERVVMDRNRIECMGGGSVARPGIRPPLKSRDEKDPPCLVPVDAVSFGPEELREATGLLRGESFSFHQFMGSSQGSSPFFRFLCEMIRVPSVDLDALDALRPGSAPMVERLCAAGYATLELGRHPSGRLVWNRGFMCVAREWLPRPSHSSTGSAGCDDVIIELSQWYEANGRLREAAALLGDSGSGEILDGFVTRNFATLALLGDIPDAEGSLLRFSDGRSSSPEPFILAIARCGESVKDDPVLVETALRVEEQLRTRIECSEGRATVEAASQLALLLHAMGRWDEVGGLAELGAAASVPAARGSEAERRDLGRYLALLGTLALVSGDSLVARSTLGRALVLSRGDQDTWMIVGASLTVLEGYFGTALLDPWVDRVALLERVQDRLRKGQMWREGDVILALSRSWTGGWDKQPTEALAAIEALVERSADTLLQPMVLWTYGMQLLLLGDAEGARALYAEVGRRAAARSSGQSSSARFVLGAVLAALGSQHLEEALAHAEKRAHGSHPLDLVTRDVMALATGRHPLPRAGCSTEGDLDARLGPRVWALITLLNSAAHARAGSDGVAQDLIRGLVLAQDVSSIGFALRVMSRQDVLGVVRLLRKMDDVPASVTRMAERSVDQPHILTENLVLSVLSPAELAVLGGVRQGLTNQGVADSLFLSVNTVKTHLRTVYRKLGVSTRSQAVDMAARLGISAAEGRSESAVPRGSNSL